ncbi:hypothetical protein [Chromobacterium subtsugae]|uniref:hypothetical protein n=1 Tax=Chromobacterium subtsugae TaxID=251747 RepID=UPI000AE1EB31|nr:hypothetical protein [Chromobacterium subtsugae]
MKGRGGREQGRKGRTAVRRFCLLAVAPAGLSLPAFALEANCLHMAAPAYPIRAEMDKIAGDVTLVFHTDARGRYDGRASMVFSATIPEAYREDFRLALDAMLEEYRCRPNANLQLKLRFVPDDGAQR